MAKMFEVKTIKISFDTDSTAGMGSTANTRSDASINNKATKNGFFHFYLCVLFVKDTEIEHQHDNYKKDKPSPIPKSYFHTNLSINLFFNFILYNCINNRYGSDIYNVAYRTLDVGKVNRLIKPHLNRTDHFRTAHFLQ